MGNVVIYILRVENSKGIVLFLQSVFYILNPKLSKNGRLIEWCFNICPNLFGQGIPLLKSCCVNGCQFKYSFLLFLLFSQHICIYKAIFHNFPFLNTFFSKSIKFTSRLQIQAIQYFSKLILQLRQRHETQMSIYFIKLIAIEYIINFIGS